MSEGLKGGTVKFKNDEIETPEMHLGAELQKKSINRISCWAVASEDHMKAAVNAVGTSISKGDNWSVPEGAGTPVNIAFVAELDDSNELAPEDITLCQEMIGML